MGMHQATKHLPEIMGLVIPPFLPHIHTHSTGCTEDYVRIINKDIEPSSQDSQVRVCGEYVNPLVIPIPGTYVVLRYKTDDVEHDQRAVGFSATFEFIGRCSKY